jgi:hypothetical protein
MDLFAWVQGVSAQGLPVPPFWLRPNQIVLDPAKWLEQIKREARIPNHPRALTGALREDIQSIYKLIEGTMKW